VIHAGGDTVVGEPQSSRATCATHRSAAGGGWVHQPSTHGARNRTSRASGAAASAGRTSRGGDMVLGRAPDG
jgi:hypothetical protein